jgi:hypothetical protein
MNKTFAVITPMLYEHTYINYFIEYHFNLGFDKIYLLIDNFTCEQDEYIINNKDLVNKIKFYYTKDLVSDEEQLIYKNCHKSTLVHVAIQKMYEYVIEDYTILLGVDSFLYLDNLTIIEFFDKYDIIKHDVSQIMFKWTCLMNLDYKSNYNLLKNIHDKSNISKMHNPHYFTLGNRSKVFHPSGDSHYYIIKNNTDKIWCNNKIYDINNTYDFYNINEIIGTSTPIRIGCIYHFMMRDMEDTLIKTYYYWNKSLIDVKELILKFILTNSNDISDRLAYINYHNDTNLIIDKINLNVDNDEQVFNNDKLINKMLMDCNLTIEQLLECANKRGLKII